MRLGALDNCTVLFWKVYGRHQFAKIVQEAGGESAVAVLAQSSEERPYFLRVVRRRGDDDPWYAEDCGATPNLQVLLNLIRTKFLTPDQQSAGRNRAADESRYSCLDKYMPAIDAQRRY